MLYLVSSLILGSSSIILMANLFNESLLMEQLSGVLVVVLGLLIPAQLGITYVYVRKDFLKRRFHKLAAGATGRLPWIYGIFYYLFPITWLLISMVQGRMEFLSSAALTASLFIGVFTERVLFFTLEKPSFFFYFANENIKLSN